MMMTWRDISRHSVGYSRLLKKRWSQDPKMDEREGGSNMLVLFELPLVSCLPMSHWPKQVNKASPESVWEGRGLPKLMDLIGRE